MFPPWPSKSFIPQTYIVYLHSICKREAGSGQEEEEGGGETIFSKPKKMCGQNPPWSESSFEKMYLNDLENGVSVT